MKGFLRPKVGLALGGGGARGLAHLGVLRVLEREKIPIDLIVGTSMGAMVGALFAVYRKTRDAETRIREMASSPQLRSERFRDLVSLTPLKEENQGIIKTVRRVYKLGLFFATTALQPSYIDSVQFSENVGSIMPDCLIENAPIPLAIVATDLISGKEVVMKSGSLKTAVEASAAIAGVFPPIKVDGRELVDGGFVNVIPVETCFRLGADIVIAVDVSSDVADSTEFDRTGQAISLRAQAILSETHKNMLLRQADVVIRPKVSGIHWAEFWEIDRIIPIGERAAEESLPALRKTLAANRWVRIRSWFGRNNRKAVED